MVLSVTICQFVIFLLNIFIYITATWCTLRDIHHSEQFSATRDVMPVVVSYIANGAHIIPEISACAKFQANMQSDLSDAFLAYVIPQVFM